MLNITQIQNYFPPQIRDNPALKKYIIKEYIQLMILDFLATSKYVKRLAFIGGTNLRLVKGIDRFSEDIDFDCKNFSANDFTEMSLSVLIFLQRSGLHAEIREKVNEKITAFRSSADFGSYPPRITYKNGVKSRQYTLPFRQILVTK